MVGYVVVFVVGWALGRSSAGPPLPSATALVAQALAGNADANKFVRHVRAKAQAGDLEAIGRLQDIDNAYLVHELRRSLAQAKPDAPPGAGDGVDETPREEAT